MTENPNSLTTISRFTDPIQAHIAKGRLETEGLFVFLANEHHIWAKWTISNALGGVELQVRNKDKEKGKEILNSINAGNFELEDYYTICENCGSKSTARNRTSYKIAFFTFFTFGIPLPFTNRKYICKKCGHRWKIST